MYKEREIVLAKLSIAIQVILTVLCFLAIGFITDSEEFKYLSSSRELKNAIVVVTLLWYIILDIYGMGSVARTMGTSNIVKGYIKAVTTSVCFLFAVNIILRYQVFELINLVYLGTLNLVVLIVYNNSVFMLMRYLRRKGFNSKQILIIADKECIPNIDEIINTKDWGFQIWESCLIVRKLSRSMSSTTTSSQCVRTSNHSLTPIQLTMLIYCRSGVNQKEIKNYLDDCSEIGVGFHYQTKIGTFIKEKKGNPSLSRINTLPFISYKNAPDNYLELKFKSLFDFFFSLTVIVLTFPVQLAIAIAIKIDDGGPVFFKQNAWD